MPACARPGVDVRRQTHDRDAAVLRHHLPGFLACLAEAGHALPAFVKAEQCLEVLLLDEEWDADSTASPCRWPFIQGDHLVGASEPHT